MTGPSIALNELTTLIRAAVGRENDDGWTPVTQAAADTVIRVLGMGPDVMPFGVWAMPDGGLELWWDGSTPGWVAKLVVEPDGSCACCIEPRRKL